MKPTQRDSYESLWNALHEIDSAAVFLPTFEVTHDGGIEAVTKNIVDAIKKAVVALERFGAGGGEPPFLVNPSDSEMAFECVALPPRTSLYLHPSPTDLRAEYLRGLEDAAKKIERWETDEEYVQILADHVRALKGKQ